MPYMQQHENYEVLAEDSEIDLDSEFYNIPDKRILDMLDEALLLLNRMNKSSLRY